MNEFKDKKINCVEADCPNGGEFVFTAGEQKFFAEHEYVEPRRCKKCRDKRKASQQ